MNQNHVRFKSKTIFRFNVEYKGRNIKRWKHTRTYEKRIIAQDHLNKEPEYII